MFDIAGLATTEYHGGHHGVQELTVPFIHNCGYQSFSNTDSPEDILICFGTIQQIHQTPPDLASLLGDNIHTTHIDSHVDPSPPAEPPPSTSSPTHKDIPPGSILDNITKSYTRPGSPSTPFDFPFYTPPTLRAASLDTLLSNDDIFPSVIRVVLTPRVFGIKGNCRARVQIKDWSLMDAGANICLTGDLSILANAVDIPPLPITVALNGNGSTVDDCCTMKGYIPLTLSDGTIHWQLCYYSANAVETIISPQAILGSSDLFASWTMAGYKDGRPGAIRFDSHDGFVTMSIQLVCRNGLYYCLTNIFTLGPCPLMSPHDNCTHTQPPFPIPAIQRVVNQPPPPILRRPPHMVPTTKARQLES